MVEPGPHHAAHFPFSRKKLNTVARRAPMTTVRSSECGRSGIGPPRVAPAAAAARPAAGFFQLGGKLETPEGVAPHGFERRAKRPGRGRPGAVVAVPAVGPLFDQS